jgi:hypothetical protein
MFVSTRHLPIGKRVRGYPFPPAVNILLISVPKSMLTDYNQLFDADFLFAKDASFRIRGNLNGDGLMTLLMFLIRQQRKAAGEKEKETTGETRKHPYIIYSLGDWAACSQWYPIAYEQSDEYVVIVEHPLYPIGVSISECVTSSPSNNRH